MPDRAARVHLSLRVEGSRLGALTDFYGKVFGAPPRKRFLDYVQFDLVDPPLNLTLVPAQDAARGEIDHLGIQVFSEAALAAARDRVVAAGLVPREETQVDCCYARQSKFWVTDPEGREVEVFLRLADIEHHGHGGSAARESATACCAPGSCEPA